MSDRGGDEEAVFPVGQVLLPQGEHEEIVPMHDIAELAVLHRHVAEFRLDEAVAAEG